jgi:short-subunit dehydrogenase
MVPAEIAKNQHEWAVVTGASSGIGRAFALELARRGHPILLVARRRDELQRVAAEITAGGGRAEPLVADLASAGGVEAVARAAEALGDVGVLVNNAGAGSYGSFLEQAVGRSSTWPRRLLSGASSLQLQVLDFQKENEYGEVSLVDLGWRGKSASEPRDR